MVEAAPVIHIGGNSPEEVAYRLLQNIAAAEALHIRSNPTYALKLRDRKWVLDTYAECLYAVRGYRSFTKMSKQPTPIEELNGGREEKLTQLSLMASQMIKDIELEWPGILEEGGRWNRSDPLTAVIAEMARAAHDLNIIVEEERRAVRDFDGETDPVQAAMEHFYALWARMEEYLQRVRREDDPSMPWQVQLKMKDGAIRAQLPGNGPMPEVGKVIEVSIESGNLTARVTAVRPTPVGQGIGQQVFIVDAEEV